MKLYKKWTGDTSSPLFQKNHSILFCKLQGVTNNIEINITANNLPT